MGPPERIRLINDCARALDGRDWNEIDLILREFGLPTSNMGPNDQAAYVRDMLTGTSDEPIQQLHDYLLGPQAVDPGLEPWGEGTGFRLFITHLAAYRDDAVDLTRAIRSWGAIGFVAHRDIRPGKDWLKVIVAALHSCDALVALLRPGFRESDWCDQEVGVVMGRGVPVIPVKFRSNPHGLLGAVQALNWNTDNDRLSVQLRGLLLGEQRTRPRVVDSLVGRLAESESYKQANETAYLLRDLEGEITAEHRRVLSIAQATNRQLYEAHFANRFVDDLAVPIAADEVPF